MSFKPLHALKPPRRLLASNSSRAPTPSNFVEAQHFGGCASNGVHRCTANAAPPLRFASSRDGMGLTQRMFVLKQSGHERDSESSGFAKRRFSSLVNSSLASPVSSPSHLRSNQKETFLIGVAGGTASGKTSVCQKILQLLEDEYQGLLTSISQDCFYRDLNPEELANVSNYNFDHPDAFDFAEMFDVLRSLKSGQSVNIPMYDYVSNARLPTFSRIQNATVVLVEGILVFYDPDIRNLFDVKLFVDTDADTRLARRMRRDIVERGRNVIQVLDRYEKTVKPSFELYTLPTKAHADIIIPRGAENHVAISLIVQHIKSLLQAA